MTTKTVNILGVPYEVALKVPHDLDPHLETANGYCNSYTKKIVIADAQTSPWFKNDPPEGNVHVERATLRHELIHAFIFESGLDESSGAVNAWAVNEEMVDWFALQYPKISALYKELECEEW